MHDLPSESAEHVIKVSQDQLLAQIIFNFLKEVFITKHICKATRSNTSFLLTGEY